MTAKRTVTNESGGAPGLLFVVIAAVAARGAGLLGGGWFEYPRVRRGPRQRVRTTTPSREGRHLRSLVREIDSHLRDDV